VRIGLSDDAFQLHVDRGDLVTAAGVRAFRPTWHRGCSLVALNREESMAKYGRSASKTVASAMRRRKKGTLKSGSGRRVKSRKQAIAIGLSEAREKGAKVPSRKRSRKR
jgi:hypothetical protein